MKKLKLRLTTKILIGVLSVIFILNCAYIIRNIQKEIQLNLMLSQKQFKINDQIILDIYSQLNKIERKLDTLPNRIQFNKLQIEQKLKQINVEIINTTDMSQGSGVSIKYRGKFYILSAGHMAIITKPGKEPNKLELWENGKKVCDLEIIKHVFTTPEEQDESKITQGQDLLLLRPIDIDFIPNYYTELAEEEPITATQVYIVGNPMCMEDVVTDGRIMTYDNNFMYYMNHTYFGNSGGGVYTQDGKLIGIVSYINVLQPMRNFPPYLIYAAVRLNTINDFLRDIVN